MTPPGRAGPSPGTSASEGATSANYTAGRRLRGQQNHHRHYYTCRFPDFYVIREAQHPRNVYVKEDLPCPAWTGGWLPSPQVRALVEALGDIVAVLAEADAEDNAELYSELGVSLTTA